MVKRIFFLLIIFFISALTANAHYNMTTPVEGESIANNELQFLVIKKSYELLAQKTLTCSDYFVNNTQVLHYPYDVKKNKQGKYIKGYWKEIWSINACGQIKQLPVTFYIKRNQTVFEIDKQSLQ